MKLHIRTLKRLQEFILEEPKARHWDELYSFFADLGLSRKDVPYRARWEFVQGKIHEINSTPILGECIKKLFLPIEYIDHQDKWDSNIAKLNRLLIAENWKIERVENEIKLVSLKNEETELIERSSEIDDFLKLEFKDLNLNNINLDDTVKEVINQRINEIKNELNFSASLSISFLVGSSIEGIFLGVAEQNQQMFNRATAAPKENGKVRKFSDWTLNDFINVAFELDIIDENIKKYSHGIKEFRNYIHPKQQLSEGFKPDKLTPIHVLKGVITQLESWQSSPNHG